MNPATLDEALALARLVGKAAAGAARDGAGGGVALGVVPPAPFLAPVAAALREHGGGHVAVGAQDLHAESGGAYTGAASATQLMSSGAEFVLVGHSERRALFGDTDEDVSAKLRAALGAGLRAILCVGETLEERELGVTDSVLACQLAKGLSGVSSEDLRERVAIAYEPVWAIGTGKVATPAQAQLAHKGIREWLDAKYSRAVADRVLIQYGGSVTPEAVDELMACPDIDGVLVGGASLKADSFARIAAFVRPTAEAEVAAAAAAHAQAAAEAAAAAAEAARANAAAAAAAGAGGAAPAVRSHATEVVACGNTLGESPVWSAEEQALYWVSSVGKELWRWDLVNPATRRGLPEVVGCCALVSGQSNAALVALEHKGVGLFDMRSGKFTPYAPDFEAGCDTRPNDGRVDRQGNFVISGYNNVHRANALESSGVYVLRARDVDVSAGGADAQTAKLVRIREENVRCSNATCFSPDGDKMYFCDTPQRRILEYEYVPGEPLGSARVVWSMPAALAGGPDGAATDAQCGVWMALSGASRVSRLDPRTGAITHEVMLPCSMPTSVTVGGPGLDTLYITTRKPDGGGLYAAPMPAGLVGMIEPTFGQAQRPPAAAADAPAAAAATASNNGNALADYAYGATQHLSALTDQCLLGDQACVGTEAMLRISLGAFVVFGILALLTARVLDAESPRALIHRGCWHLKLLLMCGAMAGFLFVPGDGVRNGYGWLARVCSGLFLCAQVVILLDAVYRWNQWWVDEFDRWKWALVTSSLVLFGCGIALTAVSYVYYVPNSRCSTNLAVVTVSLVLSLVLTLISVAFENNSAGLLTSAAFFAYTMFLVWSALGSQPPEEPCNTLGLEAGSTWVQIISFALVFASLVVNAFSSTGSSDAFAVAKVDAAVEKLGAEDTKSREASLYGEDNKRPLWKYCYSHVLIALAVAYSAMLLTGWELSDTDGDTQELLDTGWAPFWIKVRERC
eukprot:PRCOL_00002950-RA